MSIKTYRAIIRRYNDRYEIDGIARTGIVAEDSDKVELTEELVVRGRVYQLTAENISQATEKLKRFISKVLRGERSGRSGQ